MNSGSQNDVAVAVIYVEAAAAQRALCVLADLALELGGLTQLRPQLWRFDTLQDWHGKEEALEDAVNADVLVISASRANALSVDVADWIQFCFAQKAGSDAAVVVLLNEAESSDEAGFPRLDCLRGMATAAGLDFFSPQRFPTEVPELSIEEIHRRAESVTPTLAGILCE